MSALLRSLLCGLVVLGAPVFSPAQAIPDSPSDFQSIDGRLYLRAWDVARETEGVTSLELAMRIDEEATTVVASGNLEQMIAFGRDLVALRQRDGVDVWFGDPGADAILVDALRNMVDAIAVEVDADPLAVSFPALSAAAGLNAEVDALAGPFDLVVEGVTASEEISPGVLAPVGVFDVDGEQGLRAFIVGAPGVDTGILRLERSTTNLVLRVGSPDGEDLFAPDMMTRLWSLSEEGERAEFEGLRSRLYLVGTAPDTGSLTLHYDGDPAVSNAVAVTMVSVRPIVWLQDVGAPIVFPPDRNELSEEPATNRVAYGELLIELQPAAAVTGRTVRWTFTPKAPLQGTLPAAHTGRFEAVTGFAATPGAGGAFHTRVQPDGRTAARLNLPPWGNNRGRLHAEVEGSPTVSVDLDVVVPAVVVLDPGHGGTATVGGSAPNHAVSDSGVKEKDLTLAIALQARDWLEGIPHLRVMMTRTNDVNVGLEARGNLARDHGADLFLSVHFDWFGDTTVGTNTVSKRSVDPVKYYYRGTRSFVHTNHPMRQVNLAEDQVFGQRVEDLVDAVIRPSGTSDTDLDLTQRRKSFQVFRDSNLGNVSGYHPLRAALLEVEFLDSPDIDQFLNTGPDALQHRTAVGRAIADGLLAELGMSRGVPNVAVNLNADLNWDGIYTVEEDTAEAQMPGFVHFYDPVAPVSAQMQLELDPIAISSAQTLLTKVSLEALGSTDRLRVVAGTDAATGVTLIDEGQPRVAWVWNPSVASDEPASTRILSITDISDIPSMITVIATTNRVVAGDLTLRLALHYDGDPVAVDDVMVTIADVSDIRLSDAVSPANAAVIPDGAGIGDLPALLFFHNCDPAGVFGTSIAWLDLPGPVLLPGEQTLLDPDAGTNAVEAAHVVQNEPLLFQYSSASDVILTEGRFGWPPATNTLGYVDDTTGDTLGDNFFLAGIDRNRDGTLDVAEILVEYELHLVTADNYAESISDLSGLPELLNVQLSDALVRRLVEGDFANVAAPWQPSDIQTIRVGGTLNERYRHRATHNIGAVFSGSETNAVADVPLFIYPLGSAGANLIQEDGDYAEAIESVLHYTEGRFSYTNTVSRFEAEAGPGAALGTPVTITYTNVVIPMQFGFAFDDIGLGGTTGIGDVTLRLTKETATAYRMDQVVTDLVIEDLYDYAYFAGGGAGLLGYRQAGASVQAGFGHCGNPPGVGEIFVTRFVTHKVFGDDISILKEPSP